MLVVLVCRVLQRPSHADQMLHEIVEKIATSRNSICQRVRHSAIFQDMFKTASGNAPDADWAAAAEGDGLGSAKHRFDSVVSSFCRIVVYFHAVITTAIQISVTRHTRPEGRDADDFLLFIGGDDIGLQRLVLVGMFCDAGDASLQLLRFYDTENYDAAQICEAIQRFVRKLEWLFVNKHAATCNTNYTAMMLKSLQKTRSVIVRGTPITIGSNFVGESILKACYDRMCAWCVLAIGVVKAEFPAWEMLQGFSVFNVNALPKQTIIRKHMSRFAQNFDLPLHELLEHHATLLPGAIDLKKRCPDKSNADVWRAMEAKGALLALLTRYITFCGCTTSGVEHTHTIQDWLFPKRRKRLSNESANDEIKIIKDRNQHDESDIVEYAQDL